MPSKKSDLQLYADECFPIPSVTFLKSLGYSVIHASDLGHTAESDKFHYKLSQKINRTLITFDRDFLIYKNSNPINHPGIIVISCAPSEINLVCKKFLSKISKSSVSDALLIVTRDKINKSKHDIKSEIK